MTSSVPEIAATEQKGQSGGVRVLGLDPSLRSFGIARLTLGPQRKSFGLYTKTWGPKVTGVQRLSWFAHKFGEEVEDYQPNIIVIEGYAYARGQGAHQIGELGGVLRLQMHLNALRYVEVAPSKLKKFVTGKGNAKKEIVMVELYKRFGVEVPTTDEADAAGLALMAAVGKYGLSHGLPAANLTALEGIDWLSVTSS